MIFYYEKELRQFGCFMDNMVKSDTMQWTTPTKLLYCKGRQYLTIRKMRGFLNSGSIFVNFNTRNYFADIYKTKHSKS